MGRGEEGQKGGNKYEMVREEKESRKGKKVCHLLPELCFPGLSSPTRKMAPVYRAPFLSPQFPRLSIFPAAARAYLCSPSNLFAGGCFARYRYTPFLQSFALYFTYRDFVFASSDEELSQFTLRREIKYLGREVSKGQKTLPG